METSQLYETWISKGIIAATNDLNESNKSYDSIKNKQSAYALSIKRMIHLQFEILSLWNNAL